MEFNNHPDENSDRKLILPILKIHYLGHSSFILNFDNGITLVFDYGQENAWVEWGYDSKINSMGNLVPDVMIYSHYDQDHYDPERIPRNAKLTLTGMERLRIRGIDLIPVRTSEDDLSVDSNSSYIILYKNLKICHLGDVQAHIINIRQKFVKRKLNELFPDRFDLLFMPIEGKKQFPDEAEEFLNLLNPKRVMLMHFWSEKYRDDFLALLREKNKENDRYEINIPGKCQLSIDRQATAGSGDRIEVISLEREPFRGWEL